MASFSTGEKGQCILYIIMGSIYTTNNSLQERILFREFEEEISSLINTFANAKLILGGDWNSIRDPLLDCISPRPIRIILLKLTCCP